MASIRTEAQDVLDVARDGVGWIALWKNGRSWHTFTFWPEIDDDGSPVFDDFDQKGLRNILAIDPKSIIVNGWYHNLGDPTCMTRDSLADFLRWQYDLQHYLVADILNFGDHI